MKRITVNITKMQEEGLSISEAFLLLCIAENEPFPMMIPTNKDAVFVQKILDTLLQKLYIKKSMTEYILRQKGKDFVENQKILSNSIENFDIFVEEYRKLFKGKKVGSMGGILEVKEKLRDFLQKNNYTKEQILQATRNYIISMNGDYTYLQQAGYFISKTEASNSKIKRSGLSSFCEELTIEKEKVYNNTKLL